MRRLLTFALTGIAMAAPFAPTDASDSAPATVVDIAVSAELMALDQGGFLQRTIDALSKGLSRNQLVLRVKRASSSEIEELVRNEQLDLFIASSALYRGLMLSGCSDIAAAHAPHTNNPSRAQGVLFLTRLEHENVVPINPRLALRLGANDETDTVAIRAELLHHGMSGAQSREYLDKAAYRPVSAENIAAALKELNLGQRDILMLPACALEEFCTSNNCRTANLTVLWPKQDTDMACFHSTGLFPGPTLSATPRLTPFVLREVLRAVFSTSSDKDGYSWQVAANYQSLDLALQELGDGPWVQVEQFTLERFWARWRWWLAGAVGALVLIIVHTIILQIMVRRKTRELRQALIEQKKARRETEIISQKFEQQRRLQTIGQMASLFAHELGQPLNAIGCYAHGIGKAAEKAENKESVQKGIRGIEEQVGRASAIVERVRDYVRTQTVRTHQIELGALVEAAVKNFRITSLGSIPITLRRETSEPQYVLGDPLELELIVINLLRNAAQAQRQTLHPGIQITVAATPSPAVVVTDNGTGLDEEKLRKIVQAGESTSPEGLGLGLTIVKSLVELHGGNINFSLTPKGGLRVDIQLPAAPAKKT